MEILKPYRKRIDAIDDEIVDLLVARELIIKEVAHIKVKNEIPSVLQDRVDEVKMRCMTRAGDQGASPEIIEELYARLIKFSCDLEDEIAAQIKATASELDR